MNERNVTWLMIAVFLAPHIQALHAVIICWILLFMLIVFSDTVTTAISRIWSHLKGGY